MHGDQVCGLVDEHGKMAFPNATVWAAKDEAAHWLGRSSAGGASGAIKIARAALAPYISAKQFKTFVPMDAILPGLRTVATPGHTGYLFTSREQRLYIWGDIAHSQAIQFARPEVSLDFDHDPRQAVATRKEALADAAAPHEKRSAATDRGSAIESDPRSLIPTPDVTGFTMTLPRLETVLQAPHSAGESGQTGGGNAIGSPSEIARETLRQLALRKVPPTPDNYRDLYFQIRGSIDDEPFPAHALKRIASALPRATPAGQRNAQAFDAAIASGEWPMLRQAIVDLCNAQANGDKPWSALLHDLIAQFERRHAGLTQARKREALNRILAARPGADLLHERLHALVNSWSQSGHDDAPLVGDFPLTPAPGNGVDAPASVAAPAANGITSPAASPPFRLLLVRLLAEGIAPRVDGDEFLTHEALALADALADASNAAALESLAARLANLIDRMQWAGKEQHAVREALLNLLRLIVDNIRELIIDNNWLHGQLSAISRTFSGPLDLRTLNNVEEQLREVIDKQSRLKHDLDEAQSRLKAMLASFIDRLSEITSHTSDYHELLGRGARRIGEATDIAGLSEVVGELLRETRLAQESTLRAGQELTQLRERVDSANREIARLQNELDTASRLVRHDPLTGVLNRKGLDEALAREISRARRHGTQLCVALLDVDNFKQFNDLHGHAVGDGALCHLTRAITETLRPQDVVARYGGEEFIILLPETAPATARDILVRLQRELTRRIFCAPDSERLLITFSAGIAQLAFDEDPGAAIARADRAMYTAKRTGKNRVLMAG
ncbi:MAG: diguanylate cyclase [Azoarcus sp.]|jgi:diguanylate cyclase|nr:diguanylate cyclase [Azoarcus sp.]